MSLRNNEKSLGEKWSGSLVVTATKDQKGKERWVCDEILLDFILGHTDYPFIPWGLNIQNKLLYISLPCNIFLHMVLERDFGCAHLTQNKNYNRGNQPIE